MNARSLWERMFACAALLALTGCGQPEAPSTRANAETASSTAPVADSVPSSTGGSTRDPAGPVNSLSFTATGAAEEAIESDGADLVLTGGCLDKNAVGMSFTRGQITDKNLFQVRFRTAGSVQPGETGVFEVSELSWYNGQFKPEDLPTEANILVPDAYEGSGTLTLSLHEPGGLNGRMAGTVDGAVVQSAGGNEAFIKATFDIKIGCNDLSLY